MTNRDAVRIGLVGFALASASCSNKDGSTPIVCGPPTDEAPTELACTGLYADFETKTVSTSARPYAPAVSFWSDGYEKERWIQLPDGQPIDASNIDEWKFPVGTKVWKEFRFRGRKIETRLLWKTSDARWVSAAYVWSDDGKSASRGEGKSLTIAGAAYQVPIVEECGRCHNGRKDTLLGFEAISLAQPAATGVTLATLARENRIAPAPPKSSLTIDPGLAALHVNCGVSCHNASPLADGRMSTLRLRVAFDEAANKPVDAWDLLKSTVNVAATLPGWNGAARIAPGAPEESVIVRSMKARGTLQMAPNARETDFAGIATVETFIRGLPPR